jgi:hypothetical protein
MFSPCRLIGPNLPSLSELIEMFLQGQYQVLFDRRELHSMEIFSDREF